MKIMMIVSLSIFKSQEQAPATIALVITLSQRFDSISNKYSDKKFRVLKRDLVEYAECNSHNVAKCGKQSKKYFSTRGGAAESIHPREFDNNFLAPGQEIRQKKLPGWPGLARSNKFSPGLPGGGVYPVGID